MIAITFALPRESAGLQKRLRAGKIDNHQIEIVHTGVGREACERKIGIFLRANRPELLISSGFAGAVDDKLRAGDLILAENFSDSRLLPIAQQTLQQQDVRTSRLFTTASIVDSVTDRNRIARDNHAAAVDMETAFIAKACATHNVPTLSLRVISDSSQDPFPAPPSVLFDIAKQKTNFARLGFYLATHPAALPRLIAFSKQITQARDRLTNALVALIREL